MGLYRRKDSPMFWMALERPKQRPTCVSTGVPWDAGGGEANKEQRRQAQAIYAKRMAGLATRRHGIPGTLDARTFAAHRVWYEANVTIHKRGHTRERSMLKQLAAFFDDYDLAAIDQALVREWRTERRTQVSASTIRREEEVLKHLLGTAVGKYLDAHPLDGMKWMRVPATEARILTHDEERRLLAALARDREAYALVVGALDTLLRLSNMRNLTRQQDHGAYLYVGDTKTGVVKVPVSTRFRAALKKLPGTDAHYFPTYAGESNNLAIRMFGEACAAANVQTGRKQGGISFHCLRHTGASRMLAAGVDVKTVMELGGWRNLQILQRYLHPTDQAKQTAVNLIGRRRRTA